MLVQVNYLVYFELKTIAHFEFFEYVYALFFADQVFVGYPLGIEYGQKAFFK